MATKVQFFDSVSLAAVVAELNTLGECRIDKVGQPSGHEIYLQLRAGGRNLRLYLNLREQWARLHLTERQLGNVPVPTAFTMLLRKHLEGSRLLRVEQLGMERVARLVVAGRDELGDPFERILVVELIGKFSNAFLVDSRQEQLLGCLRIVTEEMSQARQLAPGLPYAGPPVAAGKVAFPDATEADFLAALGEDGKVVDRLSHRLAGISKVALMQVAAAAGVAPNTRTDELEGLDALLAMLHRAQRSLKDGVFHPRLERAASSDYAMWWLGDGAPPEGPGPSAVVDRYYGTLEAQSVLEDRRRVVRNEVNELLRKQRERLGGWGQTLAKSEEADRYRELGDLITAHMWAIQPGLASVEVTDFYHPDAPTVTLVLDPQLTASENAQRYFRKYQKARDGRAAVEGLIATGSVELAYLEQVATAVEQAIELRDLAEIAEELGELTGKRPSSPQKGVRRGQAEPPPAPLAFKSSDGLAILVGKNNKQNDYLTFKVARPHDVWLHTQNIPGSHVLVQAEGEVPEQTLHEAAMLAAYFSQARDSNQVPVVYTRRKFVKKPRGAKPGMVIYEQERTLFVNQDPERLQALGAVAGDLAKA
ncbi:hypothetical protein D3C72_908500 [compost metagenome]